MGITQISMEIPVIVLRSGVIFPMEKAVEGEGLGGGGVLGQQSQRLPSKANPSLEGEGSSLRAKKNRHQDMGLTSTFCRQPSRFRRGGWRLVFTSDN